MEYYNEEHKPLMIDEALEDWVITKCDSWRDHFEANYAQKFDEYYRLWRGIWAQEDVTRDSERSRIISPALQQAVESSVAEIEEATFGRGKFFDITDDANDPDKADIVYLRNNLHKDFEKTRLEKLLRSVLSIPLSLVRGLRKLFFPMKKR